MHAAPPPATLVIPTFTRRADLNNCLQCLAAQTYPNVQAVVVNDAGIDVSDVDYACDVVLVSEFENLSDLKSYATHPEHLRVRNELGDLRIGRHQVDYPVES